jgi:hypothetical protein
MTKRCCTGITMKSYSLLIGSNNARGRFFNRDEKLLQQITARYFPEGFTILVANGSWYDSGTGSFHKEEARQVLICTRRARKLHAWCVELGRALRQKELLLIEVGSAHRFRLRDARWLEPVKKTGDKLEGTEPAVPLRQAPSGDKTGFVRNPRKPKAAGA